MKPIYVLFAIIAILLAPKIYRDMEFNRALDLKINQATDKLKKSINQTGNNKGYVKVPGARYPFTEKKLQQLLSQDKKNSLQHGYTWHWQGYNKVTASAPGLDRLHHFVNSYLVGFKPFDTEYIWVPLYTLASRKRYEYDHIQYTSYREVWQNSREAFYYTRGDCEDHALVLADWLIGLGYDARVAAGTYKGEGHAWVVLFKDGREYLLEATSKRKKRSFKSYTLALLATDYQPMYQFNRESFWFNTGSTYTTHYSGKNWKLKSRFIRSSS